MDTLAIVILNYNGQPFLAKFLSTVLANADGHPVYVADSASTDSSVAFVQTNFPQVRIIELTRNEGYAGGYNGALHYIRTHYGGATYYVLPNSDIEVTPGWLAPVLALLEANPRMAACQPKIRSYSQRDLFEHAGAAGGFVDWLGYIFCRGRIFATFEADHGQYDDNRRVFWATGACLFVRAELFHRVGGFDESFFAHMEEIDLCWRLQRLGHEVWTCGQSVVYHVGGGTLPKSNPQKNVFKLPQQPVHALQNCLLMAGYGPNLVEAGAGWVIVYAVYTCGRIGVMYWRFCGRILLFTAVLPALRHQRNQLQEQQTTDVELYPYSIVWQYFAEGKKTTKELDWP